MHATLLSAVFLAALSSPGFAQSGSVGTASHEPRPEVEASFDAWRAQHGPGWHLFVEPRTGYAAFVGGGRRATGATPNDDAGWFALARALAEETASMTGVDPATLSESRVHLLPLGLAGGTDKLTVQFAQELAGVPVFDGRLNVLFDLQGRALSVQSTALPISSEFPVLPTLAPEQATAIARAAFEEETGLPGEPTGVAELGVCSGPKLAWQVDVQWHGDESVAEGFIYRVDAATGEIVTRAPSIHHLDVGGTVQTNATPGVLPDTVGNPVAPQAAPYVRVTSSAGTTFTDAGGAFNFPGVSGPLSCTFDYLGTFADVQNAAGANDSLAVSLSGTGNSVLMNPAAVEFSTSQANAARAIGGLRDWVRSVDPADATADIQMVAQVNTAGSCNAYFNGSALVLFASGMQCPNAAYSTVVAHEAGHWLNVLYGTGNSSLGMGEGNADVFATYAYDTAIVGEDFCGLGCDIRDGNNTQQFCGDCCEGCYGSGHADGMVWMGATWKVRARLNASLGDGPGDDVANALFLGWMNAYDQMELQSVIETQWLTLDDSDGNIDNGTPNFGDIDGGFRDQGFPGITPTSFGVTQCFGDGSGTACPCGNAGGAGQGCANGSGAGATLSASEGMGGSLTIAGAVPGQPGLFFQGDNSLNGGDGVVFGDGLRCCGGSVVRLGIQVPDGAGGASMSGVQTAGGAMSGDTKCYQFWYRDPAGSACGFAFNLSSAVEISWP